MSQVVKAHIQDGELVLDDTLDFPEGMRLRIQPEESQEDDFDAELLAEAKRRFAEQDAGHTKGIPWEEARLQIFAKR
jgi:hypothetical protein